MWKKVKGLKSKSNRSKRRDLERTINKDTLNTVVSRRDMLYKLKYDLVPSQSDILLQSFSPNQYNAIVGDLLPKKYKQIRVNSALYAKNDFVQELRWYKHTLARYFNQINEYLRFEDEFEKYFINGQYAECELILDQVEENVCVSQVTIEKRLLLAEYQHGFKKNKEVLSKIVSEEPEPLTRLFSKYISIKVEKNQSYVKYEEVFEDLMKSVRDPMIAEYVTFKLNFYSSYSYNFKGFILASESSSSIIDMYNSLICILLCATSEDGLRIEERDAILDLLLSLTDNISDLRIKLMLISLGQHLELLPSDRDKLFNDVLEKYTIGDYKGCISNAELFLKDHPHCFELNLIYIKSCINLGIKPKDLFLQGSIAEKTASDLFNVLKKNKDTALSLQSLHKHFNTIGFGTWGIKAYAFFNKQHSIAQPELNVNKLADLCSRMNSPSISVCFHKANLSFSYLEMITISGMNESVVKFWAHINGLINSHHLGVDLSDIDDFRKKIYEAEIFQNTNKILEALNIYEELITTPKYLPQRSFIHNYEEIAHGMLLCHLKGKDFRKSLQLVTNTNLMNGSIGVRLRYNFLINEICKTQDEEIVRDISTPVFLHQYQKFISPNDLWIAYDNFLAYHGLDYPKQIINISEQFERDKLIYFLKHICKPEVYHSSYLFESQEDLENERIEICLLLCGIDESNIDDYVNEISEISRNQLVRKGIKQIDESKIYVDVAGIRKAIDKDLVENFNRFLNLKSLPFSQINNLDTSNDDFLISYLDKTGDRNFLDRSAIRITTYSTFEHFKDMVLKIRNMFIASNEYGIDTYLSMRIRHGTLLGEIRSVFENFKLITKKEDTSDTYQDNIFWLQKNLFDNVNTRNKFSILMSDFSTRIDEISNELKNKKLQISTETKITEGLFNYAFSSREIMKLFKSQIDTIENHNVFFENVIAFLWDRTEVILAKIRDEISRPIKEEMLLLLSELTKNLEAIINKADYPELNDIIRDITLCQTEISNKLDKVAEWFNRSKNKVINEFYLDLPIDAALVTIKRFDKDYDSFNPKILNRCSIKFEGDTFPHFTYIMQNLFHNILKHSKLTIDELNVDIEIEDKDGELCIVIRNSFSEKIDLEHVRGKIKIARELLLKNTDDLTRNEGGTGYPKIKKTIVTDLQRETYSIEISDVDDTRVFQTLIKFKITDLQKNYNENIAS